MIEFVNIKDGRVFNGDKPYVFWFDGGQSVNLNYVRKICIVSTHGTLEARIDSDVFSLLVMGPDIPILYDPTKPDNKALVINHKTYLDLDDLKSNIYVSNGYPYNGFYIHMIYILGSSNEAGEIHDTLYITENNEVHEYEIAADFYGDNDVLKTNLSNFDVSIPESIQRALYTMDVHEESNDNILLNRKYKELLMNYWDIVANKGSYNSLQNSLAWFEWGDLVRIEELWKRHHEGMEDYFQTELNKELDYEFITEFLNNSKTTYIGLYMALSKLWVENDELHYQGYDGVNTNEYTNPAIVYYLVPGNYVYGRYVEDDPGHYHMEEVGSFDQVGEFIEITPDNLDEIRESGFTRSVIPNMIYEENNPALLPVQSMWQLFDLCLKMTLLGNFYSTYFMPIHMDLIHSTLEHWVFSYTIKVLHTESIKQYITVNDIHSFNMNYEECVKMVEHHNKAYSDTLFGNPIENGPVFGFESDIREELKPEFRETGEIFKYRMGGTYGVIHFEVLEETPILACKEDDKIVHERLVWKNEEFGGNGNIDSYIIIKPERVEREGFRKTQYAFMPKFNIGFYEPGHYELSFQFDTLYGNSWTKTVEVVIEDNTYNQITLYKVQKRDDIDDIQSSPDNINIYKEGEIPWLKSFQMGPGFNEGDEFNPATREYKPYMEHSLFLKSCFNKDVDVNHTVIFTIPEGVDCIYINEKSITVPDVTVPDAYIGVLKELISNINEYIWIGTEYLKEGQETSDEKPVFSQGMRIVGICREFGTSPSKQISEILGYSAGVGKPIDFVSSYRFHPFMHKLIPLNDNQTDNWFEIKTTDLIYAVPELGHSRDIDECNWLFENISTGKNYDSKLSNSDFGGTMSWILRPQYDIELDPGYYNILLKYKKGNTIMSHELKSAFMMTK